MNQNELWDQVYRKDAVTWRGNTIVPFPVKGTALDLGCGNGKTTSSLIDARYHVIGIDFSTVAIDHCKKTFQDSEFFVSDVTSLPLEDSSVDYVTAVHLIENLDDDQLSDMVSEISRVLKPGGYVFIRSFTERDMRSKKRHDSDIRYIFRDVDVLTKAFGNFGLVSAELKDEPTRFGTLRSRIEILVKK